MGITCKATGKMKGILKRADNQIEANLRALKEKKSKLIITKVVKSRMNL